MDYCHRGVLPLSPNIHSSNVLELNDAVKCVLWLARIVTGLLLLCSSVKSL